MTYNIFLLANNRWTVPTDRNMILMIIVSINSIGVISYNINAEYATKIIMLGN